MNEKRCGICTSEKRVQVELLLDNDDLSLNQIAEKTGFPRWTLHRHRQHMKPTALVSGAAARHVRKSLKDWTKHLRKAQRDGNIEAAIRCQERIDAISE